jgi:hypothetical protein
MGCFTCTPYRALPFLGATLCLSRLTCKSRMPTPPTQEFHLGPTHLDSPNSIINSASDPDSWSWSTLRFRPCLCHINFQPLLSFRPSFVQSCFVMLPSIVRWTFPLETSACFAIARPAALHSALQHVVSNNSTILLQLSRQHL